MTAHRRRGSARHLLLPTLSCAVTCLIVAPLATAAGTRIFRQTTAKDFEEGEATGGQILPTGEVVPGLSSARVPLEAGFVWSSALSTDGATAFFGTGDPGRVVAIPTAPPRGAEAVARVVANLDGPWVTALVARPDGSLVAATTPGARIVAIDPQRGGARELARLTADHVWALVHDARTGTTYAAMGGPGQIAAIDKQGKVRMLWDSGDKHVVSLIAGPDGSLLAGTSGDAILYRVQADGRSEAVHDFDADEVRGLARVGKVTFVAVNDFDNGDARAEGSSSKGTKVVVSGSSPASAGSLPRPGQVKAKGAIYRVEDDGRIEPVFGLPNGYFTSLLADATGELHASVGTEGKVYRILPDRTAVLALDLPERQALTLLRSGAGFLVGTGDGGGVFRARPAAPQDARYLSRVLDAEWGSRWGQLRLTGSPGLTVETRSGNTVKPDKSWAAWKKLDGVATAGDETEGRVASSPARYLQYRVTLAGAKAALRDVTVYALAQNQRARITELAPEVVAPATTPGAVKERSHSSLVKLRWKVENPDADELVYRLWYRQESEPLWRPLAGPDPLTKAEHDWNTESVPDGWYVVRVWASDVRAVPQDQALDATFVSAPVLIDNGRPEVTGLAVQGAVLSGRARDATSPISAIEFAVDGGEWRPANPTDGILDQRAEAFTVKLPPLNAGAHVVSIRVWDAADNVGNGKLVVQR